MEENVESSGCKRRGGQGEIPFKCVCVGNRSTRSTYTYVLAYILVYILAHIVLRTCVHTTHLSTYALAYILRFLFDPSLFALEDSKYSSMIKFKQGLSIQTVAYHDSMICFVRYIF